MFSKKRLCGIGDILKHLGFAEALEHFLEKRKMQISSQ
jgi:hypothetical protein